MLLLSKTAALRVLAVTLSAVCISLLFGVAIANPLRTEADTGSTLVSTFVQGQD